MTRAPCWRAISQVRSVLPQSTTTISSGRSATEASARGRFRSSFRVIRVAVRRFMRETEGTVSQNSVGVGDLEAAWERHYRRVFGVIVTSTTVEPMRNSERWESSAARTRSLLTSNPPNSAERGVGAWAERVADLPPAAWGEVPPSRLGSFGPVLELGAVGVNRSAVRIALGFAWGSSGSWVGLAGVVSTGARITLLRGVDFGARQRRLPVQDDQEGHPWLEINVRPFVRHHNHQGHCGAGARANRRALAAPDLRTQQRPLDGVQRQAVEVGGAFAVGREPPAALHVR